MELKIFGGKKNTRTIIDAEGNVFILLTPEFLDRISSMENFLEMHYRYTPPTAGENK